VSTSTHWPVSIGELNEYAKARLKQSIEPIVDACATVPADAAMAIATALVFIERPPANAAASRFTTNLELLDALRTMSRTQGIDCLF